MSRAQYGNNRFGIGATGFPTVEFGHRDSYVVGKLEATSCFGFDAIHRLAISRFGLAGGGRDRSPQHSLLRAWPWRSSPARFKSLAQEIVRQIAADGLPSRSSRRERRLVGTTGIEPVTPTMSR